MLCQFYIALQVLAVFLCVVSHELRLISAETYGGNVKLTKHISFVTNTVVS
jgi:hypothetical protein